MTNSPEILKLDAAIAKAELEYDLTHAAWTEAHIAAPNTPEYNAAFHAMDADWESLLDANYNWHAYTYKYVAYAEEEERLSHVQDNYQPYHDGKYKH